MSGFGWHTNKDNDKNDNGIPDDIDRLLGWWMFLNIVRALTLIGGMAILAHLLSRLP